MFICEYLWYIIFIKPLQNLKKIIELPGLNSRTDCNTLAKEVLMQCDLIHPSRLVEVEQTIYYLKKRKLTQNVSSKGKYIILFIKALSFIFEYIYVDVDSSGKSTPNEGRCVEDTANINSLNDYIELLYEGVPDKIKASNLILQLAREPDNLDSLSKNGEKET